MAEPTANPDSEEQDETVQFIYEHLRLVLEEDNRGSSQYLVKINRLIGLDLILFGAVAFALSHVDGPHTINSQLDLIAAAVVIALGALAAGYLVWAFKAGVDCVRVEPHSVVGIRTLTDGLRSKSVTTLGPIEIRRQLAINLATAILENRARDKRRELLSKRLYHRIVNGLLFTTLFLFLAILLNMFNELNWA